MMAANLSLDLRDLLPSVQAPTLVLHRKGDMLPIEGARYVAERIPDARFVEMEGDDHWPWVLDPDEVCDHVEEFLTGTRREPEPDRVLATVLFLSIADVGATAGGARREELVRRLRAHVSKEIKWFRGREIDVTGAGPLATFDGPARAIRCACAVREYAARLGVEVRAGLHTGECDLLEGERVGGPSVETGRLIRDLAAPGEVLVSSTVKDLVAGSGIRFDERGAHALGGAPGDWRLFNVGRGDCS
jgi:class 3 adenylate cyclase